jgi:glycosyltransferase involved in cell wall biosynthesis
LQLNRENGPTVSVIVAAYGSARYVNESIESITSQTFQDYELIVVDDASPEEVVNSYQLPAGAKLIRLAENHGVAAPGRNAGILEASGKYIAFLDMDDIWLPDKLESQVRLLEENTEAGLCYSLARVVDDDLNPSPVADSERILTDDPVRRLIYGCLIRCPSCVMVRREVFETCGLFDESLPSCADWDMWCRIARNYVFIKDYQERLLYRLRPGQLSTLVRKNRPAAVMILEKTLEWVSKERPELVFQVRKRLAWALTRHARLAMDVDDDLSESISALRKAIRTYPLIPRIYWLWVRLAFKSCSKVGSRK